LEEIFMQPNLSSIDGANISLNAVRKMNGSPASQLASAAPELLMREADHRISNSLQLVSTLLALEERRLDEGTAKQALADARRRISIVARLHKQLSLIASADYVALDDYFQALAEDLSKALIDGRRLTLLVNVDGITVPAHVARGLGLIVNELVSNALKHGFPQDREGVIEIGCGLDGDGQIALHVSDNGVGFPKLHVVEYESGLGMKMVDMLLGQMKGRMDTVKSGGHVIQKICVARE
jgi:two-component sensor histidine kinase